jgi:purine-binding chemotaxis protein CheW
VDWAELQARLARLAASSEAGARSPVRAAALLDERARALARASQESQARTETIAAVIFEIAGETFALATKFVGTILGSAEVSPVPLAPAVLVGLTNLRGEVVPVFDLARLFGLATSEGGSDARRLVVLGEERVELAIVVDRALDVRPIAPAELVEAPDEGRLGSLVRGLTADAIVVLDGQALLADERLFVQVGDREPIDGGRQLDSLE